MTLWRCANDLFGYCYKEPDWKETPQTRSTILGGAPVQDSALAGGRCINNPRTCSFYLSFNQVIQKQLNSARKV